MNIIERGQKFLQSLREVANRTAWDWRRCPRCGDSFTCKWGSYKRHPWFFDGRKSVRVQRHWCHQCKTTYSEHSALLVKGSWYAGRFCLLFATDETIRGDCQPCGVYSTRLAPLTGRGVAAGNGGNGVGVKVGRSVGV